MDSSFVLRDANNDDIYLIGEIAYKVWPLTYGEILPAGQLEYMLEKIYSPGSLKNQMQDLHHHFLILEQEGRGVGFAAYSEIEPGVFKLHKLYVLTELQGRGAGRILLERVIKNIQGENGETLVLNVNRNNPAIHFYEKQGFKVSREEKIDIGGGYFMDDYVMRLGLVD